MARARRVPFAYSDHNPERERILRDLTDQQNLSAGVTVEVTAPAAANQEFFVRHSLGAKPREVTIVKQDAAGSIFRSRPGSWTDRIIMLKYSAAGGRITLRLR